MNKKYMVSLTTAEKIELEQLIRAGKAAARQLTHARILLKANSCEGQLGWTDQVISEALDVSRATIARVRQAFVEQGLEAALNPQSVPEYRRRKLDGSAEAHLIALACSQPPQGRSSWSLRLLADEMVTLDYVESISHESVRQVLKKMS